MTTYDLYCDGASRGNPGPSSIGFVIYRPDGKVEVEMAGVIGEATNNVAEYRAVIAGLEMALHRGISDLAVKLDSLLLVKQIEGDYRVKAKHLKPLRRQAVALLEQFDRRSVMHVPREKNTVADRLANEALDEAEA